MRFLLFCLIFIGLHVSANAAPQIVRVGVTHFPPFYETSDTQSTTGLGMDVIEGLNALQSDYTFVPILASPRRRHQMFAEERFDMSFFDHLEWGWDTSLVDATDVYLEGGEVYATLKTPKVTDSYFDDIVSKSLAGILGYHYGFANYETDPIRLKARFDITLTNDHEQILKIVMGGRAEVGIFTETYLKRLFQKDFMIRNRLVVSGRYDQRYGFRTIVRKGFTPSARTMQKLMTQLRADPNSQWITDKYGLDW